MGRLSDLHQELTQAYNAEEFKGLCFDLDVPYDSLTGDTLPTRVAALLRYLDARDRLPELVTKVSQDFPKQTWQLPSPREASTSPDEDDGLPVTNAINNNSGNVVIGSKNVNVIQIGSLNIPRSALFGLMGLVTVIGIAVLGLVWSARQTTQQGQAKISEQISTLQVTPTSGPLKMNGVFNIAVAPFAQTTANGQLEFSSEGLELSDWIYKALDHEIPESNALIWSDTLDPSKKGSTIGIITGTTATERQKSAQQLAARIGAQMVIFGQLTGEGENGQFEPEFYIDTSASKLKGEADEVLGGHKFGPAMRVTRPMRLNADDALRMNQTLNLRAVFVKGVLLDLIGRHIEAYKEFKNIKLPWTAEEMEGQGKEVLPIFMARQLVFLLDRPPDLKSLDMTRDVAVAQAQSLVEDALFYNPNYALAHLQQGNLALSRAEPVVGQAIDQFGAAGVFTLTTEYTQAKANIISATQAFSQFLALAQGSTENDQLLVVKAHISLANVYRLDGYSQWLEQRSDAATILFNQGNQELDMVLALGASNKPRLLATAQWVRGDITLGLAIIRYQQNDEAGYQSSLKVARIAFERCAKQSGEADTTLNKIKAQCQQKLTSISGGTP